MEKAIFDGILRYIGDEEERRFVNRTRCSDPKPGECRGWTATWNRFGLSESWLGHLRNMPWRRKM